MEHWLEWARGPLFRASFAIMILGLLRVLVLQAISLFGLIRQAKRNQRKIPYAVVAKASLRWLIPVGKLFERRAVFSLTSVLFHICIIVVPILLGAHILLWERGIGLSWPAISMQLADILTLGAIVTGLALFVIRLSVMANRAISRAQDYVWPLLIVLPFLSGYLAMHPAINPFSYEASMLIHVLSANLIFLLLPFSKLSHMALFPATQLVSELGWFLKPDSAQKVMTTLHKENEAI